MDETLPVEGVRGFGQRSHQSGGFARRQRPGTELVGQAAAGAVLHRQKGPVVVTAHFIDLDDVRMTQPAGRFRLRREQGGVVAGPAHLEGHHQIAGEPSGPVHDPHGPGGEPFQQFVIAEARPALPPGVRQCARGSVVAFDGEIGDGVGRGQRDGSPNRLSCRGAASRAGDRRVRVPAMAVRTNHRFRHGRPRETGIGLVQLSPCVRRCQGTGVGAA